MFTSLLLVTHGTFYCKRKHGLSLNKKNKKIKISFSEACPILCSGKGIYMHGLCKCHPGWKGRECEFRENECEVPDCNGNGHCINGQCVCFQGFQGPDCGIGRSPIYQECVVLVL